VQIKLTRFRILLILLILTTLLPLGVLSGVMVGRLWQQQRVLVEKQNLETARAISVSIDQEVDRSRNALQVAAKLELTRGGISPQFSYTAHRLLRLQPEWRAVMVFDRSKRVIFSSVKTKAWRHDSTARDWLIPAFQDRIPTISNLMIDFKTGQNFFIVAVPIIRHGIVQMVLAAQVYIATLSDVLLQQKPLPGSVVTLIDRTPRVMTQSAESPQLVGALPDNSFLEASARGREGSYRGLLHEQQRAYSSLSRSTLTGWTINVALPAAMVDAPILKTLWILLFAVTTLSFLAVAMALLAEHSARRETEKSNRTKNEFIAMISHELRTPLSVIFGWAKLLRSGAIATERVDHALAVIERNVRSQTQLLDDLLDVSRITTGKLSLDKKTVDLTAIVRQSVEALQPLALEERINILLRCENETVMVYGDAKRLRQVFLNLLTNACKFTGSRGEVMVSIKRASRQAMVSVADTGCGIDADLLPHIFERFKQGDSVLSPKHQGMGIGLALVQNVIQLHHGSITAHSAGEGQGACFTVTLPLLPG
jgi:signal transduction histidine kinase